MMKKIFSIAMILYSVMMHADWDKNQNNNYVAFNISHSAVYYLNGQSGTNIFTQQVNGSSSINIFAQQSSSLITSVPSFVILPNNKPNQPASIHQQSQNNQLVYYLISADGQKEVVSKERFDQELAHVTDAYVQAAQTYFRADMKELASMINQAILQGTINLPETQNQLIHQAIIHAVTTGQTTAGIMNIYLKHPWILKQDLSDTSLDDQIMINYAISRLDHCNNSGTIELAQGCLRAFDDAQQAQSEGERAVYQKMSASCYSALLMNSNITSKIVEPDVHKIHNDLVDVYYSSCDSINAIAAKIDSHPGAQSNEYNQKYLGRLIDREAVVLKTLQNDEFFIEQTDVHFALSTDVAGYLMANNLNYASFNNKECIFLQHFLTNQIVDLLEKNVGMVSQVNNYMLADFIQHTCHLAVSAQQLNQDYEIKQAISLADVSELFTLIGQAVVDCIRETSIGVKVGSIRSLQSWITVASNLSNAPIETAGQGIQVVVDVALVCGHLVSVVANSLPTMPVYNFDTMQYDTSNLEKLLEPHHLLDDLSKKYQSAKTGLSQAVEYSIPIVQSILQRPAQENIADVTQCIVDGIFIHGIGKALSYGATFAKVYLTGAAETMAEVIAPQLMHEPFHFATTSTGDIVACIDRTGEIISDVAQVAGATVVDGTMLVAQGNNLYNKVNNSGGNGNKQSAGDKGKPSVESIKGSAEWKKLHPHGEFRPSAKHHANSPDHIGKPPHDGQAALDNSFAVKGSTQRVTVQNENVVILKFEEEGIYHGYIHKDLNTLKINVKDALVENGFLKDATSKKLIIK